MMVAGWLEGVGEAARAKTTASASRFVTTDGKDTL
jgi:hypothetical protein